MIHQMWGLNNDIFRYLHSFQALSQERTRRCSLAKQDSRSRQEGTRVQLTGPRRALKREAPRKLTWEPGGRVPEALVEMYPIPLWKTIPLNGQQFTLENDYLSLRCFHCSFLFIVSSVFPGSSAGKEFICNMGDLGSIPGSRRSAGEGIGYLIQYSWASQVAQLVKNLPAIWETWVWYLGWEDPLEGKTTHSSILARRIPWTV